MTIKPIDPSTSEDPDESPMPATRRTFTIHHPSRRTFGRGSY